MNVKKYFIQKIILLKERIRRIKKRSIYCIVAGLILSIVAFFLNDSSIYKAPYEIERGPYGAQKAPYKLHVDVDNLENDMEFNVSVSSRKYEKEEADRVFLERLETLKTSMLNGNESYERIDSKLNFLQDLGDGIRASYVFEPKNYDREENIATYSEIEEFNYYVKYRNVIDGNGNVKNEDFKVDEYCTGYIEIQLSTEIKDKEGLYKSEKIMIPVKVVSRPLTAIEAFKVAFRKKLIESDNDTISDKTIKLPRVVNNLKITYSEKINLTFLLMPFIGVLIAILLEARDKEKERERQKKRNRRLEIDYTQIITKVLLYVSSGMTIRNSMIRLAEQYQKEKCSENNKYERAAYEELIVVRNKLSSGYSEVRAYEEMAKSINMRCYTRFLNIIIQSIKNGNKELKNILNMEVQDALYERKQKAKRLGEEAATKLVLPLMMMLAVIMVIIMVPAFMGM